VWNTVPAVDIGPIIRRARKAAALSQPELSDRCGWGFQQARISHYETGRRVPNWEDIEQMAEAMNLSVVELLEQYGGERTLGHPVRSSSAIESRLSALSPKAVEALGVLLEELRSPQRER